MSRQNFSEKNKLCMKEVLVVRTVGMGFWNTQSLHYRCGSMHHLSLSRGRQAWRRWQMIGLVKALQLASIIIFVLPQLSISIGSRPLRAFGTVHSVPLPCPSHRPWSLHILKRGVEKWFVSPIEISQKIQEIKKKENTRFQYAFTIDLSSSHWSPKTYQRFKETFSMSFLYFTLYSFSAEPSS